MTTLPIVVLISGRGSNLKAIIDAHDPLVEIRAVISNRPEAAGLIYAKKNGIPTRIIDHHQFNTRHAFDTQLQTCIEQFQAELIVLAGFMRILSPEFVTFYQGRLINIHPSLLPNFKGLHTHQRALKAGVTEHGATVHFVTEDLDAGPVIRQASVPIFPADDEARLAARVLVAEHRLYPEAIHDFATNRISIQKSEKMN